MKKAVFILSAMIAPALLADDSTVRKVIELKHAQADRVKSLLSGYGVMANADNSLHAITIIGTPDGVKNAEEAVRTLDVAPPPVKNVEVTAYLVMASNEPQNVPEPAELAGAIKQMRGLFPYKSYRLLDTILVHFREGESVETSGMAPSALKQNTNFDPVYRFQVRSARVDAGEPMAIHVDHLLLMITIRDKLAIDIGSSFDVKAGQKVVLGKTNPAGTDGAVALVVTARVAE